MTERYRGGRTKEATPRTPMPQTGEIFTQDDKVKLALQKLEAGIDSIVDSDSYKNYLQAMSRFHTYSYNNVALIHAQRPDAERVAGYRAWQDLGRQVKKGERGIQILYPMFRKVEEQGKEPEQVVTGYGLGYVFDVKQTDGDPLPISPLQGELSALEGNSAKSILLGQAVHDLVVGRGANCSWEDHGPGFPVGYGYYRSGDKHIGLLQGLEMDHAAKTMTHEAAHFLADHRWTDRRDDAETVAEGSAYVVLQHFGLDSGAYSFNYVASWAGHKDVLKRNLDMIQKTSTTIIDGIDGSEHLLRGDDEVDTTAPTLSD